MQIKKLLHNNVLQKAIGIVVLSILFFYLYKLLIPRINAFGCMDDCNNFVGGYFLLQGKQMFSQIFFNHQPFMAYLSEFVQYTTHPQNLHEIILRHRQFGMLFDFLSEIILFLRFGFLALPFAFTYELTKFYIGGDRFLAEGYIVYPLVYLLGIVFAKFFKKKIFTFDYFFSAILTWFVLYMREPQSISVLILFGAILWNKTNRKIKLNAFLLFLAISLITLLLHNIPEFFYNVVYVNKTNLAAENADTGFLGLNVYKSFLYPLVIYFQGVWSFFRMIELIIASVFIGISGYFTYKKHWKWLLFLWVLLGFANIRIVVPGEAYYGIFHIIPWYGLTLFASCLMLWESYKNKKIFWLGMSVFTILIGTVIFSKGSYTHDHIDQQTEFITNYGNVLQVGNIVAALSTSKDTLFLDGFDDMIYFVAHRYSTYQYSWYTSLMPQYKKYTDARLLMFRANPPDFYYGSCPGQKDPNFLLPSFVKGEYARLYNLNKPSCLWVKKSVFVQISPIQWQQAAKSLYFGRPYNGAQ